MSREEFYEWVKCKLDLMGEKIDRLDEAIRGNGKDGLTIRIDRLETSEASRERLGWIVIVAMVSSMAYVIWNSLAKA